MKATFEKITLTLQEIWRQQGQMYISQKKVIHEKINIKKKGPNY